ncbi:MAG: type II toxin-antitoxin system RelE/ParE family toxin [Candidatus Adiutrix sp.]|jgi:putative addiction module killer protein|nr:type II toxin-antitoxin system RelE/ParE family toxin [Candidatus Adiutrix sp.]
MKNEITQTEIFSIWLKGLTDKIALARINARLDYAKCGNFGDCKPIGGGLSEMRIHYGPGYRIYYGQIGESLYLLLAGGIKDAQRRDIDKAVELWKDIKEHGGHDEK